MTAPASGRIWSSCPVCGRPRQHYAGSKLTAHAVCSAPPGLPADLLAVLEAFSPHVTVTRLAADVGVSVGVMRGWIKAALRHRAAVRRGLVEAA